mmetsp:Transcript_473/g.864  ORF Transcript_473/g.864 Transcript_473/m.864 type:complete len:236 (+) Transcript_473:1031-1738(+)
MGNGQGFGFNPLGTFDAGILEYSAFLAAATANSSSVAPHCTNHRRVLTLDPTMLSNSSPETFATMARYKSKSASVGAALVTTKLLVEKYPFNWPIRVDTSSALPSRMDDATLIQDEMPAIANDDPGEPPANELAECPPKNNSGEEPRLSKALCIPDPHRERKMALRCVMVSGPMVSDKGSFFCFETITLVWYGGHMVATRARRGSEERVEAERVRVASAERGDTSAAVMVTVYLD